jgi:glycosyltransferase involved in cell wall biosynthesis
VTRVHQALSAAGPYDAVTGEAHSWRALLEGDGRAGGIHAETVDPRANGVAPLASLEPAPDDLVVIHYSAFAARMRRVLELPGRKLLVYHNVTPARYLWNHHPGVGVACALGRSQLPRYARACDRCAADSLFNARELETAGVTDPLVVPILLDPARLSERGDPPPGDGGPLVLVVGRLVPNKRHDLVLAAFAAYQRECAPDARLLCAGEPLTPAYRRLVERLVHETGAGNVTIAGGISQARLNAAYAEADVLLSMSEHEGFCVPLLEAFHFGVPVVARPVGAMPEVGGDAVLWTSTPGEDEDAANLPVTAELIDLAVGDSELRTELVRRGRARLDEYSYERTAAKVEAAVDAALA